MLQKSKKKSGDGLGGVSAWETWGMAGAFDRWVH